MSRPAARVAACGLVLAAVWWIGRASGDEADGTPTWRPTAVALLDVSRIFKESPRLVRLRDDLKQDFEVESVAVKALNQELNELKKQAAAAPRDDANLQRELRAAFDKKMAEYRAEVQKVQKDFAAREAEVYRAFYADVRTEVDKYAAERGITLVIRSQSEVEPPAEITEVKDVQRAMSQINQLVVYHDALDITDAVIDRMKSSGSL